MAIVVFNPQNLEQERLEEEGAKLRDFFLHGSGARCNLSSLYFQPWYGTESYLSVSVLLCRVTACASMLNPGSAKHHHERGDLWVREISHVVLLVPGLRLRNMFCFSVLHEAHTNMNLIETNFT